MVQISASSEGVSLPPLDRVLNPTEKTLVALPIDKDKARLEVKRPTLLGAIDRLIFDLMRTNGSRNSEVLAHKSTFFIDGGLDFDVVLKALKQRTSRPTKKALQCSSKRYIHITDPALEERIQCYLDEGNFKKSERAFSMSQQEVNLYIHALVERVVGVPFAISSHSFQRSFAVHLLLHGRPFKYVSRLPRHESADNPEIFTDVSTVDGAHFWMGWTCTNNYW